jgi:ferritin
MLSKKVQEALNEQIRNELYSAYLYLSMSAYAESVGLPGFASWMRAQSQEEVEHAMKLFDYIADRDGRVTLLAIAQPAADFKSPLAMFQQTLDHEREVTKMIHRIYDLAAQENDYGTMVMLQWFITEQVEEEKTAGAIVDELKMVGDKGTALYLVDRQLASRKG